MLLQNENNLEDKILDEIIDPIYDIICKSSIRGIMSNVKQLVDISPVKFKFGFKFYNYYDVIFAPWSVGNINMEGGAGN